MYERPRLNRWERLFLILFFPVLVLIAMLPWQALNVVLIAAPALLAIYAIYSAIKHLTRKKPPELPVSGHSFRMTRRRRPPAITHRFTVSDSRPVDSGQDLTIGSEKSRRKRREVN